MLDFSEEQVLAQQAIRSWCALKLEPKVLAMEAGEISIYPVMREMAATFGIADMAKSLFAKMKSRESDEPKKGIGSDPALMAILSMELSRVCPGFALAFGASLGLFAGGVMARGTLDQKERWALPVLTMDRIGAWGLTEPGAGSDAFGSMKTHARRVDGGFQLNGSKTFITNAPYADVFLIYARMLGDEFSSGDIRAFIVERSDTGVSSGPPMRKMGMHASPTGEIFLGDVFVPAERLLGGEKTENARTSAKSSLNQERSGMTPMLLGMVERCLDESIKYAKSREQWGKPIASFQLVQDKIARIYMARTVIHTMLMRQLEAEKAGVPLTAREASATKLYCARAATDCAMEAVQLMGGAGYMTGSVVEMMARDAKLFQIGGGTDEIQILRIARELLEQP